MGSVKIGFRFGLPSVTNVCNGQVGGGTVLLLGRGTVARVKASVRGCGVFRGFVYADVAGGVRGYLVSDRAIVIWVSCGCQLLEPMSSIWLFLSE